MTVTEPTASKPTRQVKLRLCGVAYLDARQLGDGGVPVTVDRHLAERRREGARRRQRKPAKRYPVRRAEQHDAGDPPAHRRQAGIGRSRHRSGINVARMGHDDRLRRGAGTNRARRREVLVDVPRQPRPVGRIECAGHGGRANGGGASNGHGARLALPRRIDPDYIITARK